ncbi:uncharacterized protein LOC128729114 [Anopheles nili]|uniref:uncharacterized protein LOC128729114 n=1 Tax=Anopheles nili TaxID=185578 RepID=UPI00237BCC52|nr:uncharacterized protein LOC128729114 [Anopheles nili]
MCDSECVPAPPGPTNGLPALAPCDPANGIVEAINPAVQLATSLSAHSIQHAVAPMQQDGQATGTGGSEYISAQELELENHWLREKLKEITADRDRLLCEVANLRLELDMAELKRLPEHR